MLGDLTTLGNVTAYLQGGDSAVQTSDQAMVRRLISAASRAVLGYLNRASLVSKTYTEVRDGTGQSSMMLRQWPVTSYTSLTIESTPVPASPPPAQYGWRVATWDGELPGAPSILSFVSGYLRRGAQNITHVYTAGYLVTGEAQTVPSAAQYQIPTTSLNQQFAADAGVTYANGAPLAKVTGTPAQGQYVAPTDVDGNYVFAAADASAGVLISYSFTPADIQQVAIELVAERYAYLQRIGVSSRAAGDTKETYWPVKFDDLMAETLQPYRNVAPI
ncbi:hypothetical protein P3T40_003398 [Paraburkholderia sp. EB58]|jgi:hypothetical protein|uniref:hypothetical protein n=1 Tax=Paraburkholderia sp. EB58 TaxID=3035125 RepID=UPI003D2354AD